MSDQLARFPLAGNIAICIPTALQEKQIVSNIQYAIKNALSTETWQFPGRSSKDPDRDVANTRYVPSLKERTDPEWKNGRATSD